MISIDESVVHKILGVPIGGVNLDTVDTDDMSADLIRRWKLQYKKEKIRPSDVSNTIIDSDDDGELFKLNFLVLFVNSMAECSPAGACLNHFLTKIGSTDMIRNINWSGYILDCIRRSKRKWKRDTYDNFYSGPLTFLTLLYVHMTLCEDVEIDRNLPPLHTWTMELLRNRTKWGFKAGGLHKARLISDTVVMIKVSEPARTSEQPNAAIKEVAYHDNHTMDASEDVIVAENIDDGEEAKKKISESLTVDPVKGFEVDNTEIEVANEAVKNVVVEINNTQAEPNEETDEGVETVDDDEFNEDDGYDDEEELKKEYMAKIDAHFDQIYCTKWDLGNLIREAMDLFPDEVSFDNYQEKLDNMFMEDEKNEDDDTESDKDETVGKQHEAELVTGEKDLEMHHATSITPTKLDFEETGSLEAPFSQIWCTQTTFDIIDKDIQTKSADSAANEGHKASEGIERGAEGLVDKKMVPYSKGNKETGKGKEEVVAEDVNRRASKREINLGDQMRSPYVKRQVLLRIALTTDEKKAHEFCLAAFRGPDDTLYQSETGNTILRAGLENLAGKEHVFRRVIDGWVDILNYEERYRNINSPRRLFYKTTVLEDGVLLYDIYNFKQRFQIFSENLAAAANNNMENVNQKNVDLIYFPLMQQRHYYCVVFNLKMNTIEILDNIAADGKGIENLYNYDVHILHTMMVHHMNITGHPAAKKLQDATKIRLESIWQTRRNFEDSGVFLMRHMECYNGGGCRSLYTGLDKEGPG